VLVVAFLACCSVTIASAEENTVQSAWHVHTVCPFPEISPHNHTTNLAHENDCSKFYKCFLGRGIVQLCPYMEKGSPARLHYNIFEQVCDWPWRAGCSRCPKKDEDGNYLPPSKIPHESGDCNLYYDCVDGEAYLRRCSSGTCFSRTCQACIWNSRGGICDDSRPAPPPSPSPPPSPPPPPPPEPICHTGNRKIHDCHCGKYYECFDNEDWILQECQGGLHFSPTTLSCLPADEVNCSFDKPK
jgi:hypothetical protein